MPECSEDRDRTRCAQEVMTGAWREPPASLPMSTQEPFWRNLFETPSVPNSRSPPVVRQVRWELLHPISAEDVTRALKEMKDGTPGPDGRRLQDVKTIPGLILDVVGMGGGLVCLDDPESYAGGR